LHKVLGAHSNFNYVKYILDLLTCHFMEKILGNTTVVYELFKTAISNYEIM